MNSLDDSAQLMTCVTMMMYMFSEVLTIDMVVLLYEFVLLYKALFLMLVAHFCYFCVVFRLSHFSFYFAIVNSLS